MSAHPTWLADGVLPEELVARIRGALHDLETVVFEANKWIAEHGPMFADYDASVRALPECVADVLDDTTGIRTLSHRLGVLSERLRAVDELRGDEQVKVIEQARADYELTVRIGGHTVPVAARINQDWLPDLNGRVDRLAAGADGAEDQPCGHVRPIGDLLGRGEWRCMLPAGHDGAHAGVLGSDSCRWYDDGSSVG